MAKRKKSDSYLKNKKTSDRKTKPLSLSQKLKKSIPIPAEIIEKGHSWDIIARFDAFTDADKKRLTTLSKVQETHDVKVHKKNGLYIVKLRKKITNQKESN